MLDGYKLNPDKFKWLDIDIRSDMDAIQSQMKQVKGLYELGIMKFNIKPILKTH